MPRDQLDEEAPVVGAYDFGALVARIEHAVRRIGARRVSLDSLSAVFTRFADGALVRHEMHRIGTALAALGVTSVVTAERTHEYNGVSNYGVEEFVLDNVIILRNVPEPTSSGAGPSRSSSSAASPHRTGEWLFTIDPRDGLVIIPLAFLDYPSGACVTDPGELGHCRPGPDVRRRVLPRRDRPADRAKRRGKDTDRPEVHRRRPGSRRTLPLVHLRRGQGAAASEARPAGESTCAPPRNQACSASCATTRRWPRWRTISCEIRRAIEEFAPVRLVIDTLSALERIASPRALLDFVITLGAVARQHGITTLLTAMPAARLYPAWRPPIAGELASLTDVAITLTYYEQAGEIQRAIAVIQTRGSAHDPRVRQVAVDADGMHIRANRSPVLRASCLAPPH